MGSIIKLWAVVVLSIVKWWVVIERLGTTGLPDCPFFPGEHLPHKQTVAALHCSFIKHLSPSDIFSLQTPLTGSQYLSTGHGFCPEHSL